MDAVEVLVVGAGVVGLAVARALARAGREVVVAERAARHGMGTSSRSSEVVHAGLYDEPGSLKAELCVRGRALLYAFCAERGVAHARCGKLVVATRAADEAGLQRIAERGRANGVDDLVQLSRRQARALEPALECTAALHSPSSGIVSAHELMTALLGDAEQAGAALALGSRVVGAARRGGAWHVRTLDAQGRPFELEAGWIVNAAGLDAQALARALQGFAGAAVPPRRLAKGNYFALATGGGRAPFSRLIYPTPVDGGLGVHLTLDLAGQARFGPDVEWLDSQAAGAELDYGVDPARAEAFYAEVRRYWPGLPDGALVPAYSGVRPKLAAAGAPAADFRIDGPQEHGVPGVVHLFGIESPGLTASLAIAERVTAIVES
ncbi:MAG: NAD(P)/FAD-dependent oxidoreductase [Rubrivivax sp.]